MLCLAFTFEECGVSNGLTIATNPPPPPPPQTKTGFYRTTVFFIVNNMFLLGNMHCWKTHETYMPNTNPTLTYPSYSIAASWGSHWVYVALCWVSDGSCWGHEAKCKSRIWDLRGFVSKCTVNVQPGHAKLQTNCRHLLCWIVLDTRLSALTVHILLVSFSARQDWEPFLTKWGVRDGYCFLLPVVQTVFILLHEAHPL